MKKNMMKLALKGTKKDIFLLVLLSAIFSYLTLEIAVQIRYAIDGVICQNESIIPGYIQRMFTDQMATNLLVIASIIVVIYFLIMLINYVRGRMTTKLKLAIYKNVTLGLYSHILRLKYKNYRDFDKAEMLQRVTEDSEVFACFFEGQFNLMLDVIFFGIFVITESITLNWMVATYLIVTILLMLAFSIWYLRRLNQGLERTIEKSKNMLEKTVNNINHVKLIRMFHKQIEEIQKYQKLNDEYTEENMKLIKLILFYEIVSDHITYLKAPIIYMIGGVFVVRGTMSIRHIKYVSLFFQ